MKKMLHQVDACCERKKPIKQNPKMKVSFTTLSFFVLALIWTGCSKIDEIIPSNSATTESLLKGKLWKITKAESDQVLSSSGKSSSDIFYWGLEDDLGVEKTSNLVFKEGGLGDFFFGYGEAESAQYKNGKWELLGNGTILRIKGEKTYYFKNRVGDTQIYQEDFDIASIKDSKLQLTRVVNYKEFSPSTFKVIFTFEP